MHSLLLRPRAAASSTSGYLAMIYKNNNKKK
jgi:hypothetical protein